MATTSLLRTMFYCIFVFCVGGSKAAAVLYWSYRTAHEWAMLCVCSYSSSAVWEDIKANRLIRSLAFMQLSTTKVAMGLMVN